MVPESSKINLAGIEATEVVPELRTRSEVIILDFDQISPGIPEYKDIRSFFQECVRLGINPRLPENRQHFNNNFLVQTGNKYLIGRYCEDRSKMLVGSQIAAEGRFFHLGIDLFSRDLEPVFSPLEGRVVRAERELGPSSFGYYIITEHEINGSLLYVLFGHLSRDLPQLGRIAKGQQIATLGDFVNEENGGWSRHLHVQLLREFPPQSKIPIGYSTFSDLPINQERFLDPRLILSNIY